MREKILRNMLLCSLLFFGAAMSVMLYFSANKTIVIAEETSREPAGSGTEDRMAHELIIRSGREKEGLSIPLPGQVRGDDIVIENRGMEHCIYIIINGEYGDFYNEHALTENDGKALAGSYSVQDGKTRLRLTLRDLYEQEYVFENGKLRLRFVNPRQLYGKTVVLDAAHGGKDAGEVWQDAQEKEIALAVVEKAKELLEAKDIRVYCTRTDDRDVPAADRLSFVNQLQADLLVSVHVGADMENPRVFGIRTFYNETYFIPYFGNVELADLLERETVTAVNGKANGLYPAPEEELLLAGSQIPSAAIELGYLTNEAEGVFLQTGEYQQKLAEGIARAVESAFAQKEKNH